jgi:IS5 family transposase
VECYLRLMFLKFRHRLGYESLCAEVADSIAWRRFCRIPLDGKLTTRCGEQAVAGLNEALWAKAFGAEAAAHCPGAGGHDGDLRERGLPDGLGAAGQGVRQAGAHGRRVRAADGATGTVMTDRAACF